MTRQKQTCGALSVGQVAARSGVAVSALHFYETKRLIKSWRNAGNQRRYSRDVLRRIAVIKAGQAVGIPLGDIREALATLPVDHVPNVHDWAALSVQWRDKLDARIDRLVRLRDQLGQCIGCGCLSLDSCPLYNPEDIVGKDGPGARFMED